MYKELVKRLRDAAKMSEALAVLLPHSEGNATEKLYNEAADAIKELQQTAKYYLGCSDGWYKEARDYKAICEQIVEAQHTEMFDERDKQTLMEMAKSLPLQIIPNKDEKPRWIPVTERLPENDTWVLRYSAITEATWLAYLNSAGVWMDEQGEVRYVTHWMPLPEPPKEE